MNHKFLAGILLILATLPSGCSKNGNSNNSQQTASKWSIAGTAFQATTTYWDSSTLVAKDTSGNFLYIYFLQKPATTGTYNLQHYRPLTNSDCFLTINSAMVSYFSAGMSGDTVRVSVTGTNAVAAFSNVTLYYNQGAYISETKASGTIVQQ